MEMKKYKLGEIATVEISGVDKKTKDNEIQVKLCNFTDVYHNWAITKDMADSFMDATVNKKEFEIFSLKKGQVAFTKDSETRDDIGIPTYIADDFENVVLGYHTALITPNKSKLSGKYLNAFMNTQYIHKFFENNASGSGQRYTLSTETINSIPIITPDIITQEKIGNIFSNLDRKIALNRSINRNLEALAKQLYDYWFVQFDFPNAEGKPYKSSGGKMVWNDKLKREVPEGWEVKKLEDTLKCDISGDWGEEQTKGNHTYKVNCIRGCDMVNMTNLPERYIIPKNADKLLETNDFVIEISGGSPSQSTGRIVQITEEIINRFNKKVICSNFCHGIRLKEANLVSYFLQTWNTFYKNGVFFNYEGKTSGLKNFQFDSFFSNYWYFPPMELARQYHETYSKIKEKIDKTETEITKLTALRDKLLPLLMNGQVEVKG